MNPEMSEEQERWIRRYKGLFGEPVGLHDFRSGTISFRELYDRSIRFAENMVAEVQYIQAIAFEH